jgi:hypothetical protein
VALAFLGCYTNTDQTHQHRADSFGVEMEHRLGAVFASADAIGLFMGEDKYCIHFLFVTDMSRAQVVPAISGVREREEVDENNQVRGHCRTDKANVHGGNLQPKRQHGEEVRIR